MSHSIQNLETGPSPQKGANSNAEHGRKQGLKRLLHWCVNSVPAVVALLGLSAVAWWGQSHDWKLPKFSAISGQQAKAADDWCVEHSVPESICVTCKTADEEKPKGHGWCRVHGVAECPFEHPETTQLSTPPHISEERLAAAQQALKLRPRPANNSRCKTHLRLIQVPSADSLARTGIEVEAAMEECVVEAITATGEIKFDQTRTAHLSSRAPGTIWRVEKQIGDSVKAGDVLLLIDALEVGKAKGEFLKAIADARLKQIVLDRLSPLANIGAVPTKQIQEAAAALQESEIRLLAAEQALWNLGLSVQAGQFADLAIEDVSGRLKFLGLPSGLVAELKAATASANLIPIKSPVDGVIIAHDGVASEVVDTTTRLITVADRNRLWVTLDIPVHDAKYVKLGQRLLFQPDGSDRELAGQVDWIADEIDVKTRTVKVRAQMKNDSRQIKALTFGQGCVVLRETPNAVVVPNDALHWEGCCHIVFVRNKDFLKQDAPKLFEVRKVRPGVKADDHTELIAGLLPGEVIATRGSEALRVELLKGSLGAG